jgi:flavin-dependent dehydrogenase
MAGGRSVPDGRHIEGAVLNPFGAFGEPLPRAVRIAGAGLAGLVAATVLAGHGRSVEVFEKKSRLLPSSGAHTEGVRNYRYVDVLQELRGFGFTMEPIATVQTTVRHSPNFVNVLHGPAYYLFMRGRDTDTVDQTLYRQAMSARVRFHFGKVLDSSEADIVATGPPRTRANILGAGYTFSAKGSPLGADTVHALLDNEVAPGGYLVLTPGRPFHSIYSVSWSELRFEPLLERTEAAFEIPWVKELLGASERVGKIHGSAYFTPNPYLEAVQGGALYVGEAGGFQDAVAGFGFRYAVITGSLAARAILEGQEYRGLLKGVFGDEFHHAQVFREKLQHATNADYDKMIASLGPELTLSEYVQKRDPRGF